VARREDPAANRPLRARAAGALRNTHSLDPLEIGSGVVFGWRREAAEQLDRRWPVGSPRQVLEGILLEALRRPPCLVAFSGGRDSSAVLAEATRVARAHGLEDPVPHTMRFAEAPRTAEDEWQELTVRHLGLGSWSRRELTDELDALGPIATDVIRHHGLHWPPNLHAFQVLLEPAAGGSLITGNGGDELFGAWAGHRLALLWRGRARPRRGDVRLLIRHLLPSAALAEWWVRRGRLGLSWLRPAAAREVARGLAVDSARIERSWAAELDGYLRSRYVELLVAASEAMARRARVHLVQPFLDPAYVRAVCADAPREGFQSRTAAVQRHFGDLLPPGLVARSHKAIFSEVFFGPRMRAFAQSWSGAGLDTSLVAGEALRAEWLSPKPQFCSLVPLQAAWAADNYR
jgi:asparagine synthase (glutamine-hydrolysing)